MIFHGDTFLLAIYDLEMGNDELLNRFAVPKVSGYEYYDDFGTPLLMNFDAVDAVLTILNVWVIFSAH